MWLTKNALKSGLKVNREIQHLETFQQPTLIKRNYKTWYTQQDSDIICTERSQLCLNAPAMVMNFLWSALPSSVLYYGLCTQVGCILTTASSLFSAPFWCYIKLYICYIFMKEQASQSELLLEIRVKQHGDTVLYCLPLSSVTDSINHWEETLC